MSKLENTPENKARFFSQYLWQIVVDWEDSFSDCGCSMLHYSHLEMSTIKNKFLRLTPLSIMSDKDYIEIAKIENSFDDPVTRGEMLVVLIDNGFTLPFNSNKSLECFDYLRSKGYALPFHNLSVDDLVSYGWIKLKGIDDEE